MKIKATAFSAQNSTQIVRERCPACGQRATFETVNIHDLLTNEGFLWSLRRCPDPTCHIAIVFVSKQGVILDSFPALTIDFDATNIPVPVRNAFEEAIKCHSESCFVASAIMVRKTLEELCSDRQARGDNLKDRIKALGTRILIPAELIAGLDDLRLLGNDAAHIESKEYEKVGKEEVEVGIEFAKEVLKAVYQYSALLGKLRALKKLE